MYKVFIYILIYFFVSVRLTSSDEVDSLQGLLKSIDGKSKVDLYVEIAAKLNLSDPNTAIEKSKEGLKLADQLDYKKGKADLLTEIGRAYLLTGNNSEGLMNYMDADRIYSLVGGKTDKANIKYLTGLAYNDLGDYDKALKNYFEALKIIDDIDAKENKKGILLKKANILKSIGTLYRTTGYYDDALKYLQKSLAKNTEIGNMKGCITCYLGIGRVYQELNDFEKALNNRREALKLSNRFGIRNYIGLSLQNIGESYASLRKYFTALDYYKQGLNILLEVDNRKKIIDTYIKIGDVLIDKDEDIDGGIDNYTKALKLAQESNLLLFVQSIYQKLYKAYELKGDFPRSLDYYRQFTQIHDSLFNMVKSRQLSKLRIEYEIEQKDKEIEMLKMDNMVRNYLLIFSVVVIILVLLLILGLYIRYRDRKKTNDLLSEKNTEIEKTNNELVKSESKLMEANASKDKFFSILAHDLKNPFNVLLNHTETLSANFENIPDQKRKKYINDIYESSNNLLKLTDNLLEWSRTQTGRIIVEPSNIDLYEPAFNNVYLLKNKAEEKGIKLTCTVEKGSFVLADFNVVNTVIRNLLSNAVKFTDKGGRVDISANIKDNIVEIAVRDTGIGIPEDRLKDLFRIDTAKSTPGTANEQGTGLGLIICKEFIERSGGEICVESKEGEGSTFFFTLPLTDKSI